MVDEPMAPAGCAWRAESKPCRACYRCDNPDVQADTRMEQPPPAPEWSGHAMHSFGIVRPIAVSTTGERNAVSRNLEYQRFV